MKNKSTLVKLTKEMWRAYIGIVLVCALFECLFLYASYSITKSEMKTKSSSAVEALVASLQAELNKAYETSELIKDLYKVYGDLYLQDFEKISNELIKGNLAIGSMYFAPDAIIKYSYPAEVNSATANFEMLKDPIQGPKAQKAIDDRKATIAGPHHLLEGGEGFIIRNPIFNNNDFIAFSIVIINQQLLLDRIAHNDHFANYNFAVWKEPDPTVVVDSNGFILTKSNSPKKISRDIEHSFEILNDKWHIALEPVNGWNMWSQMKASIIGSLLIFSLLLILFYIHFLALGRKRLLQSEMLSNKAKSNFLFSMSHDIRTPMNAIIGFVNLMQKNIDDKEKIKDYLSKISDSSNFLLSLINNVLEMARIESGKVTLNEKIIDAYKFEEVTDAVFADIAKSKDIAFSNDYQLLNDFVLGDEMKIRDITLNIVSNAIKYTPRGGFVKLSLVESKSDIPGYTMFTAVCEDSGVGISKDYLPHIFEEFSRERNSTDSNILGTGLGMPIVKKLLDQMNGTIDIQSELGKGTKVTITLPLRLPSKELLKEARATKIEKNNSQEKKETISFTGKRILLAEDNDLNAEIAIALFEEIGFEVVRVVDGAQCVQELSEQAASYYDLIIMDVQMPNMNGYEATQKIRMMADTAKASIPIIAMTANAFDEDKKRALEAGMNEHVAKPISLPELVNKLKNILNH